MPTVPIPLALLRASATLAGPALVFHAPMSTNALLVCTIATRVRLVPIQLAHLLVLAILVTPVLEPAVQI